MELKTIFGAAVAAVLLPVLPVACDTEVRGTLYTGDGEAGYAFAAPQLDVDLLVSDGNRILVPLYRSSPDGQASIEVRLEAVSENASGVFSLESGAAVFEDGSCETEVAVVYEDIGDLALGDVYRFTLSFDTAQASPTGISSVTVSARRDLVYRNIGTGIYTCTFFKQGGFPAVLEVQVEKADGANAYRLLDVFRTGYPIEFTFNDEGEIIEFDTFATGMEDATYGMLYFEYEDGSFRKEGNTLYFDFTVMSENYIHDHSYDSIQLPDTDGTVE